MDRIRWFIRPSVSANREIHAENVKVEKRTRPCWFRQVRSRVTPTPRAVRAGVPIIVNCWGGDVGGGGCGPA